MNLRNVLSITVKELIQFRRDPTTVALTLFLPIFAISIVNFGFGNVRDVPMVISNQDGTGQAQKIVDSLRSVDTFKVVLEGNLTDADARQLVHDGFAKVAVIIPRGTGDAIARSQQANITVMVDATDTIVYQNIRGGLGQAQGDATKKMVDEEFKQKGVAAQPQPVNFITDFVYGQDVGIVDSMTPILVGFMQSYISMALTSVSVVKEKLSRTLERVLAAPVTGSEILLGKLIASSVVTLAAMILLLVMGLTIFKIKLLGSILDVLWLAILTGLGGLGLGLAASAIAKREAEAVMMMAAYIAPCLLLTGFLWPIQAMAPMFRSLAYLVPLTYANDALRSVMLGGLGLSAVINDIIPLAIFAVGTLAVGTLMFRREIVAET
jgi:ABC-2 type transport system permease protein